MNEQLGFLIEANVISPLPDNPLIYQDRLVKTVKYFPIEKEVEIDETGLNGQNLKLKVYDNKLSRIYFAVVNEHFNDIPPKGLVYAKDSVHNLNLIRIRMHSDSQSYYMGRAYHIHDSVVPKIWVDYQTIRNNPMNLMYPIRLRLIDDLYAGFPGEIKSDNENEALMKRLTFYGRVENLFGIELSEKGKMRLGIVFGNVAEIEWRSEVITTLFEIRDFLEIK